MKLELMDWKNVERESERLLREHMVATELNTEILKKAKKQIKILNGLTSEEEAAEAKKKIEKDKNKSVG